MPVSLGLFKKLFLTLFAKLYFVIYMTLSLTQAATFCGEIFFGQRCVFHDFASRRILGFCKKYFAACGGKILF